MLDLTGHPDGQLQFCSEGRGHIDFDLVDENMVRWGRLDDYKVLLHTSGTVFGDGVLAGIASWVRRGGVLVTHGRPDWREPGGSQSLTTSWLGAEDLAAGAKLPGMHVYRLGKGAIYVLDAAPIPDYLRGVVGVLSSLPPLYGFKAADDGTYATDFPDGRLCYDTKTQETTFRPLGGQ
jgi:hypothetical protein